MNLTDQVSRHEIGGHEIGGQAIDRLKINDITMQRAILFKATTGRKSQQQSKLYNMLMYTMF